MLLLLWECKWVCSEISMLSGVRKKIWFMKQKNLPRHTCEESKIQRLIPVCILTASQIHGWGLGPCITTPHFPVSGLALSEHLSPRLTDSPPPVRSSHTPSHCERRKTAWSHNQWTLKGGMQSPLTGLHRTGSGQNILIRVWRHNPLTTCYFSALPVWLL